MHTWLGKAVFNHAVEFCIEKIQFDQVGNKAMQTLDKNLEPLRTSKIAGLLDCWLRATNAAKEVDNRAR